jgi:SAM-dependent methyltransferase
MQSDSGLQRLLKVPLLYNWFQDIIGGTSLRRKFIQNQMRAKAGDKVIDIGCGPAEILPHLPAVEYLGFDVSEAYIARANQEHAGKGTFVVGDTKALLQDQRFRNANIVIALGVLHHLDDEEVIHCIRFAHDALKPGGRFLCLEACWVQGQGPISKYVMSKDRGKNIRTEQSYRCLANGIFKSVNTCVDMKPMRIPYVTVVLECLK